MLKATASLVLIDDSLGLDDMVHLRTGCAGDGAVGPMNRRTSSGAVGEDATRRARTLGR